MTRHSVNITLCRTIKYSAALLRQTFNRGCRLYLFVCDESFSPLNGTLRADMREKMTKRQKEKVRDIFFSHPGTSPTQPFIQIRFWPKKSSIKLINYKISLPVSISLVLLASIRIARFTWSWHLNHACFIRASQTIYVKGNRFSKSFKCFISLVPLYVFRHFWKLLRCATKIRMYIHTYHVENTKSNLSIPIFHISIWNCVQIHV